MVHPELQVMVYGDDIATARVSMQPYDGVTLKNVVEVQNPNYAFVHLHISDAAQPGTLTLQFEHSDGTLTRDFELRPRRSGTYAQGFSSEDVIYLMMPDRFANGNPENDEFDDLLEGVDRSDPNARHGGDFAGVMENLDYIDDIGMTAIWFTPVFENDMPASYGAYHGYAATDMYEVDRRFGTNQEFLDLVDACHDRGIKVIMDMIHNHVGLEHWWMDDLPTDDWVHSLEEEGQTNYRGAVAADPYRSDHDHDKLTNGWFVPNMPDLNQDNELLAQYLIQNTVWWIEYSGIDGIRMDTYLYPDKDYMARWAEHVLEEFPSFNMVGESWVNTVPHEAYWQDNFEAHPDGYDSQLPSVTDFPMQFAIRDAFNSDFGWQSGISHLYYVLSQDHIYPEPNKLVTFLDNHDLERFATQVGQDTLDFKMAYAFQMTTRGIPQVYYGTELMLPNDPVEGDGRKRTDMMGGWPDDPRTVFTEEGRTEGENAIYDYVQRLTTWRQEADVVHAGDLTQFVPNDGVYVYFRYDDDDTLMVVLNNADTDKELSLDRFDERILDHTTGTDVITGDTYAVDAETLTAPARTPLVLELEME